MSQTNEKNDNKLSSRKFIVWLVWLILTVGVGVYAFRTNATSLLEKILDCFFAVSMMYLGMNAGQKVGFALSDALAKHNYSKEEEDE